MPDDLREEEKFMYKYLESREVKSKKEKFEEIDPEESDEEMEAFAEKEIKKEMDRLQSGAGPVDEEGDDLDVSYSDDEQENEVEKDSDEDFFSDEDDLEDVD